MNIKAFAETDAWVDLKARLELHDLTLRCAQNTDTPALQHVVFSCLEEHGLPVEPHGTDADLKDVAQIYFEAGGTFVVLTRQGQVLGTAGVFVLDDSTCELRKMYFLPQLRGMGLAKRLLTVLMQWSKQQGFKTMTLETATSLKAAISLYKHMGFKPFTPEHAVERCDQAWQIPLG